MRILYITPANFQAPNAAALRNIGLSQALSAAGHDVILLAAQRNTSGNDEHWSAFPVVTPQGSRSNSARDAVLRAIGVQHGAIDRFLRHYHPDLILVYQAMAPLLHLCLKAAERHGLPLLVDVTEWHDAHSLPGGRLGPHLLSSELGMRRLVLKADGVVCVSHGLARHYSALGCRTLVVPPIFDLHTAVRPTLPSDRIHLSVAGSGQKDQIALTLLAEAVNALDPHGRSFRCTISGLTQEQATEQIREIPRAFEFVGRVPWKRNLELVRGSDMSVVLRQSGVRRMEMGFPSKVPESLLLGTPILGNHFSDMAEYLQDGCNAILIDSPDSARLTERLEELLVSRLQFDHSRIAQSASGTFTPTAQAGRLDTFMRQITLA